MPAFVDRVGHKFGKLTVIAQAPERDSAGNICWICRCDCGEMKRVAYSHLRAGSVRSCGCLRHEERPNRSLDRIGQKFGLLTIVARASGRTSGGNVLWIANCDCGTRNHVISSNALGQTKSCGCLRRYYYGPPSKREIPLTQFRLKELLRYEPKTGQFFWQVDKSTTKTGDRAGSMNDNKYEQIDVDGKKYKSHRLAWLYVYGYFPERLDHKNRNKSDNRIANLREATRSQNGANSKVQRTNHTGLKGVTQHGRGWQACVGHVGKRVYLGTFDTKKEAHIAYCEAAERLYGEFFCSGTEPASQSAAAQMNSTSRSNEGPLVTGDVLTSFSEGVRQVDTRWYVTVGYNGKYSHLGGFARAEVARAVYWSIADVIHDERSHTEDTP
jgi:hypothetical protein